MKYSVLVNFCITFLQNIKKFTDGLEKDPNNGEFQTAFV